jgi:hypothetical protein
MLCPNPPNASSNDTTVKRTGIPESPLGRIRLLERPSNNATLEFPAGTNPRPENVIHGGGVQFDANSSRPGSPKDTEKPPDLDSQSISKNDPYSSDTASNNTAAEKRVHLVKILSDHATAEPPFTSRLSSVSGIPGSLGAGDDPLDAPPNPGEGAPSATTEDPPPLASSPQPDFPPDGDPFFISMYCPDPPNPSSNNMAEHGTNPGQSSPDDCHFDELYPALAAWAKRRKQTKPQKDKEMAAEETTAKEEGADSLDPPPNPGGGSSAATEGDANNAAAGSPATLSYASMTEIWHPEDVSPDGGVRFVPSASDTSRPGGLGPQPYLRFDDPFIMGNVLS